MKSQPDTDSKPFIHEDAWKTTFRGYDIIDVAVRDRNFIYLALVKVLEHETCDDYPPTRIAVIYRQETDPKERWSHRGLENFKFSRVGASRSPTAQGMIASRNGDVYAMGSRQKGMEHIAEAAPVVGVMNLRCIDGRTYAACMFRTVYRRMDVGRWEALPGDGIAKEPGSTDQGFLDIDGFSESDIYAVGGLDDVFHFEGDVWTAHKVPGRKRDEALVAVCCAGDGKVYVASDRDSVYCSRDNQWTQIHDGGRNFPNTRPYEDLRWFDGKLWLCGPYGFGQLKDGKIQSATTSSGVKIASSDHMDAGDGVIVFATSTTVTLYDGQSLVTLVKPYE